MRGLTLTLLTVVTGLAVNAYDLTPRAIQVRSPEDLSARDILPIHRIVRRRSDQPKRCSPSKGAHPPSRGDHDPTVGTHSGSNRGSNHNDGSDGGNDDPSSGKDDPSIGKNGSGGSKDDSSSSKDGSGKGKGGSGGGKDDSSSSKDGSGNGKGGSGGGSSWSGMTLTNYGTSSEPGELKNPACFNGWQPNPNLVYGCAVSENWGSNPPQCGDYIKIGHGGKSVTCRVIDKCSDCKSKALDLTQNVFEGLAELSAGILNSATGTIVDPSSVKWSEAKYGPKDCNGGS